MDLLSFLAQARDLDRATALLPHASGFRPALAGAVLLPVYDAADDWEADFGEVCRPWHEGDEPLSQPYAIATRRSIDEFLAANPHVTLPPAKKSSA